MTSPGPSRRGALGLLAGAALGVPTAAAAAWDVPPDLLGRLSRGFNLPGWLDDEVRAREGAPSLATLRLLRDLGFRHVRLPVRPERLATRFSDALAIGRALDEARRAVDLLLELDYAVMLDMHPGEGLETLLRRAPEEGLSAAIEAWRRTARGFATISPDRLCFELLNEPPQAPQLWAAQAPVMADAVRAQAPRHTLVVGPATFQRVDALATMAPLPHPNVVYAVHFYDPMAFTHQGQTWSPGDPLSHLAGVPFPSRAGDPRIARLVEDLRSAGRKPAADALAIAYAAPWTAQRVAAALAPAAAWSRQAGRPVILNEFGVLRWRAAPADRAAWLGAVRRAAEAAGLGWTHWDYADGFGLAMRGEAGEVPDPVAIEALLAP